MINKKFYPYYINIHSSQYLYLEEWVVIILYIFAFISKISGSAVAPTQISYLMGTQVKWSGCEADHSPVSNAEVSE